MCSFVLLPRSCCTDPPACAGGAVSYERPPPPTRREGHLDHRSSPVPEPCIPDVHDYRGNVWVVPGRRLWVQVPPIVVQRCHARRERALVLGKEAGAPRDEASHRLPRGSDELSSSVSCAECVSASLRLCRGVPHPGASQSPFREGFVDTNGQFTSVTIPGTFGTEIDAKLQPDYALPSVTERLVREPELHSVS
jgi:hypothetical protein